MSPGKLSLVVLATLVIFATGVVTGGLLVSRTRQVQAGHPTQPFWSRFEVTRRAVSQLPLSPEQRTRIDDIIRDNQELIADYFRILEPDVQQVFHKMRERIGEELTPEQRGRFEELARRRFLKSSGQQSRDGHHPSMNPPADER